MSRKMCGVTQYKSARFHTERATFEVRLERIERKGSKEGGMRLFACILVLIGGALFVDEMIWSGHYRDGAWRDAKQQGQQINMKLNGWLKKYGF